MKIAIICGGQIFGNEDVLYGRNYTTSVRCLSSDAQVYCIRAEEFNHRFSRDDTTWKMLLSHTSFKDSATVRKIKNNIVTDHERKVSTERDNK